MAKNRYQEALRQRNIRRRKKREHDKYKAFKNYVFSQNPELVLSFEARQGDEIHEEFLIKSYINDFDLSLLYKYTKRLLSEQLQPLKEFRLWLEYPKD